MTESKRYGHWYEREHIELLAAHLVDEWDEWLDAHPLSDDYGTGQLYMPPHLEDKLPEDFHAQLRRLKKGY